jgi:hypothetical protein
MTFKRGNHVHNTCLKKKSQNFEFGDPFKVTGIYGYSHKKHTI